MLPFQLGDDHGAAGKMEFTAHTYILLTKPPPNGCDVQALRFDRIVNSQYAAPLYHQQSPGLITGCVKIDPEIPLFSPGRVVLSWVTAPDPAVESTCYQS